MLMHQVQLFTCGQGAYRVYRIPAVVTTPAGCVLAFCEGRRHGSADDDETDLLLRRSADGGATFSEVQTIANRDGWTCGNPCPVVNQQTGTIQLLFCMNRQGCNEAMICRGEAERSVWVTHSDDDGLTWSAPREITSQVKREHWGWYATGPGHAIQLCSGRLLVPCDHVVINGRGRQGPHHSHVIYSDNHGVDWHIGGVTDEGTNESTVLEAVDGGIYLNCRNFAVLKDRRNYRAVAWSADRGETFGPIVHDAGLPEPICQASVCRLSLAADSDANRVLYSGPTGQGSSQNGRNHLTIRLSYDECRTWPVARVLHEGPAGYSDLCVLPDGTILCLYECGHDQFFETLTLARFDLAWLTEGEDRIGRRGQACSAPHARAMAWHEQLSRRREPWNDHAAPQPQTEMEPGK